FVYNPFAPYKSEFHRMNRHYGWTDKGGDDFRKANWGMNRAAVLQFNALFGKKKNELQSWQKLFSAVEGVVQPQTLDECFLLVQTTHINICDLLDSRVTGVKIKNFDTEVDLSRYTIATENTFPRDHVLAGELLYFLLRHILNPSTE
ncbi:hypothetical protein BDV93DRAFT_460872, partial [Ceratobasidium sp. AG-I]